MANHTIPNGNTCWNSSSRMDELHFIEDRKQIVSYIHRLAPDRVSLYLLWNRLSQDSSSSGILERNIHRPRSGMYA